MGNKNPKLFYDPLSPRRKRAAAVEIYTRTYFFSTLVLFSYNFLTVCAFVLKTPINKSSL